MTSQPAAVALFTIVLEELCDFSVATFRQKIERCAEGGDGGLTRATVACGLPAEDVALHLDGAGHGVAPRPGAETVAALVLCHVSLVKHCLGLLLAVSRQQVAPGRVAQGASQKARGWWKELPPRGRSAAPLIPRIPRERGVLNLFPLWTPCGPPAAIRPVGNDRRFTDVFLRHLKQTGGRVHMTMNRLQRDIQLQGCQLGHTLPKDLKTMWPVAEDIVRSPDVSSLKSALYDGLRSADGFHVLTVDGTMKIAMVSAGATRRRPGPLAAHRS